MTHRQMLNPTLPSASGGPRPRPDPENARPMRKGKAKPQRPALTLILRKVVHIESVPESWDVPDAAHHVAYILDVSNTPELLKLLTVDAFIKKECQDSFLGPTGSTAEKGLAKVIILDNEIIPCRRSNLTCSGCYTCTLASDNFLDDCKRWNSTDEPDLRLSAPIMAAKASEANSLAAVASAFYCGVAETYCKGQCLDSGIPCGGRAILRKFTQGKIFGKAYFIGCSNWALDDSDHMSKTHRFPKIPSPVRESILVKLFKGEPIDEEDDDTHVLAGSCMQIMGG
ncbi:hypothetical protein DFH09DRAFT_412890 [Mycena vulgaris]|nr:hypothetical protein DFH09DRAFT_412890 [Mycena vulgaris]